MTLLSELFPEACFRPVSEELLKKARERLDSLTKPKGSLGRLEDMAAKIYAIGGGAMPLSVEPGIFYVVAGDHGVAAQNVSPFPQEVTRAMVQNFFADGAAINALTGAFDLSLRVVDAGCAGWPFPADPMLISRRLGEGTEDFSQGPAMSLETCARGLRAGFELGANAAAFGYRCVGVGEMGIANTTAATALFCALLGLDPAQVAGPGTGASPEMVGHKAAVVKRALETNAGALADGPLAVLGALGGFEIVEMTGIMLACAAFRIPLIVDGFISASAYAAARALFPAIDGYAFLSHKSAEPGFALVLEKLGASPYLDLGLRLGEGTGAALFYPLLRAACAIFNDMATMEEAGIAPG